MTRSCNTQRTIAALESFVKAKDNGATARWMIIALFIEDMIGEIDPVDRVHANKAIGQALRELGGETPSQREGALIAIVKELTNRAVQASASAGIF